MIAPLGTCGGFRIFSFPHSSKHFKGLLVQGNSWTRNTCPDCRSCDNKNQVGLQWIELHFVSAHVLLCPTSRINQCFDAVCTGCLLSVSCPFSSLRGIRGSFLTIRWQVSFADVWSRTGIKEFPHIIIIICHEILECEEGKVCRTSFHTNLPTVVAVLLWSLLTESVVSGRIGKACPILKQSQTSKPLWTEWHPSDTQTTTQQQSKEYFQKAPSQHFSHLSRPYDFLVAIALWDAHDHSGHPSYLGSRWSSPGAIQ